MLLLYFIMLFSGMFIFSSKRKHLLLTLLSLEFMVLSFFMILFFIMSENHQFYSLLYLVFGACEVALGLSILVSVSRAYGSDYFSVFSLS